jgi:hypothetical protein
MAKKGLQETARDIVLLLTGRSILDDGTKYDPSLGGGGGASATDIGNAVNGTPITGQTLETGGAGNTGWLASLRKAITDRFPAAAVLSDALANPTTALLGASNLLWDGTQWVRQRQAVTGSITSLTGILNGIILGRYNATRPTLTDGDHRSLQLNLRGDLRTVNDDQLPATLGTKTAALSLSTTDATPPLSTLATPHSAVAFSAGAAATSQSVVQVDLNSLTHRGEFAIECVVTGNGTSPGAGTLLLKWAYSSDTPTVNAALANSFVSGAVNSQSIDILATINQSRRAIVRDLAQARYLYLWLDVPTIAASATLTVTTRVVAT